MTTEKEMTKHHDYLAIIPIAGVSPPFGGAKSR
jgi:hypothetical protein